MEEMDSTLRISKVKWQGLEKKPQKEQKLLLQKYWKEGKFTDEPVSARDDKRNVKRGDHIFQQGGSGLYEHHFLCTAVYGDNIEIIEYSGPVSDFSNQESSDPLAFASIKKETKTFEQLEKKKAKVRKWPEELQRYPVDAIIERAEKRNAERQYDVINNNCESFVTWCICGLNTSLQVTSGKRVAIDSVKAIVGGAFECVKNYVVKEVTPFLLNASAIFTIPDVGVLSNYCFPICFEVGGIIEAICFEVGGIIEAICLVYNVKRDCDRMKKGFLSKRQFKINTVTTCAKGICHLVGGNAGSIICSPLSPVESIVGCAIGYGVAHAFGSAIGWGCEKYPKVMDGFEKIVVAPVKKCVNPVKTCVNAVKTGVQYVCKKVKCFFKSLFSW